MKLLLDTHIFLWSLLEPNRLTQRVASELENPANEICISPITTWEVLVLAEKGRIFLDPDPVTWIRKVYMAIPFKEAPLNHEVAIQSRLINLPDRDPGDRFLVATARVYAMTLITADERLLRSQACLTLPNSEIK
jgi:PIN domain nuclease of toxin-antitoxin system